MSPDRRRTSGGAPTRRTPAPRRRSKCSTGRLRRGTPIGQLRSGSTPQDPAIGGCADARCVSAGCGCSSFEFGRSASRRAGTRRARREVETLKAVAWRGMWWVCAEAQDRMRTELSDVPSKDADQGRTAIVGKVPAGVPTRRTPRTSPTIERRARDSPRDDPYKRLSG